MSIYDLIYCLIYKGTVFFKKIFDVYEYINSGYLLPFLIQKHIHTASPPLGKILYCFEHLVQITVQHVMFDKREL